MYQRTFPFGSGYNNPYAAYTSSAPYSQRVRSPRKIQSSECYGMYGNNGMQRQQSLAEQSRAAWASERMRCPVQYRPVPKITRSMIVPKRTSKSSAAKKKESRELTQAERVASELKQRKKEAHEKVKSIKMKMPGQMWAQDPDTLYWHKMC